MSSKKAGKDVAWEVCCGLHSSPTSEGRSLRWYSWLEKCKSSEEIEFCFFVAAALWKAFEEALPKEAAATKLRSKGGTVIPGTHWQDFYISSGLQVAHRDTGNEPELTASAVLHTTTCIRGGHLTFPDFKISAGQQSGDCAFFKAQATHACTRVRSLAVSLLLCHSLLHSLLLCRSLLLCHFLSQWWGRGDRIVLSAYNKKNLLKTTKGKVFKQRSMHASSPLAVALARGKRCM